MQSSLGTAKRCPRCGDWIWWTGKVGLQVVDVRGSRHRCRGLRKQKRLPRKDLKRLSGD